jgi:hypothetical protein
MQVYIHTGHLSVDNGAQNTLTFYVELAEVLEAERHDDPYGYGYDWLEFPDEAWPVAKALLEEHKMLYRFKLRPGQGESEWQNVQTDVVRRRLNMPLAA